VITRLNASSRTVSRLIAHAEYSSDEEFSAVEGINSYLKSPYQLTERTYNRKIWVAKTQKKF
jgi:hypothetical protein